MSTNGPVAPAGSESQQVEQTTQTAPVGTQPSQPNSGSQPPAQGGAQQVEPSWLKGRLEETRSAAIRARDNTWTTHFTSYQESQAAKVAELENKIRALTGLQPPDNSEETLVRDQFGRLYPNLAKVESQYDKIERALQKMDEYDRQLNHYWGNYGRQSMQTLEGQIKEAVGGTLSPRGQALLLNSFIGHLQSNEELAARYERDPGVIDEYAKAFVAEFIDPVRRSAASTAASRVPGALPQDTPSGAPQTQGGRPQFKNDDERGAAAWAAFQQIKNQRS